MALSERLKNILSFLNGFRKFTIMAVLILIGIIFRVLGFINGEEMVDLLQGTAIAFFASNGLEHMTTSVKEWLKGQAEKRAQ